MPNKRIIVSETAYADLDETLSYIASDLHSPGAAGKLIDKIFDSMERLGEFPLIGSATDNDILNAKGYRLPLSMPLSYSLFTHTTISPGSRFDHR